MSYLIDFLTFRLFISPSLLVLMYYCGAVIAPLFGWLFAKWLMNKYLLLNTIVDAAKNIAHQHLSLKHRTLLLLLFLFLFFLMEIMWRMMFEFFIAYFQMHEALQNIH